MNVPTLVLRTFLLGILLGLTGCATTGDPYEVNDPYESFNRTMYGFNDGLDRAIIKPVAKGYKAVMPSFVDTGISNFFSNLNDISVTVNDVLQVKLRQAGSDLARLVINSTLGLLGVIDISSQLGFSKHNEDFGQTLGAWGVNTGPYLVLPIFGPSNVRDGFSLIPESYMDPVNYIDDDLERYGLIVVRGIDTRADLLGASRVLDEVALDPYEFLRDGYLQRREFLVYDGNPPEEDLFEEVP